MATRPMTWDEAEDIMRGWLNASSFTNDQIEVMINCMKLITVRPQVLISDNEDDAPELTVVDGGKDD